MLAATPAAEVDEWKLHSEQLALTTWAVGLDTMCAVRINSDFTDLLVSDKCTAFHLSWEQTVQVKQNI